MKVEREGKEPVLIELDGSPLRAPALEKALRPAFQALAQTLFPNKKEN